MFQVDSRRAAYVAGRILSFVLRGEGYGSHGSPEELPEGFMSNE